MLLCIYHNKIANGKKLKKKNLKKKYKWKEHMPEVFYKL